MRFNGLDLNLLVALDALLAEGSITRAAHRVHLTQSAMSGALARLREHFDDPLFVQVGRKMVRTPLADGLEAAVRDILLRIDSALDIRPQFAPAESKRRFVIAASDYIMAVLLDRVLARACTEAPGVTFALEPLDKGPALLDQGEIDLLIIPPRFGADSHPSEVAIRDTYTCVVWNGNTHVGRRLTMTADLQLLLGLGLYALSPTVHSAMADMAGAMKDASLRFWAVEHLSLMLLAVVFIHIGRAGSRRKGPSDRLRHRKAAIFFGLALAAIFLAMPWPWLVENARPYLPALPF